MNSTSQEIEPDDYDGTPEQLRMFRHRYQPLIAAITRVLTGAPVRRRIEPDREESTPRG
jgi:hypothetical protein